MWEWERKRVTLCLLQQSRRLYCLVLIETCDIIETHLSPLLYCGYTTSLILRPSHLAPLIRYSSFSVHLIISYIQNISVPSTGWEKEGRVKGWLNYHLPGHSPLSVLFGPTMYSVVIFGYKTFGQKLASANDFFILSAANASHSDREQSLARESVWCVTLISCIVCPLALSLSPQRQYDHHQTVN